MESIQQSLEFGPGNAPCVAVGGQGLREQGGGDGGAEEMRLVRAHEDRFREGFREWLIDNLVVWRAFEGHANRVWSRGRAHYAAKTIVEVIRHETLISEFDGEFKINNNITASLARLYALKHPDRASLFEFRGER